MRSNERESRGRERLESERGTKQKEPTKEGKVAFKDFVKFVA